jgi:hypothetical protein
MATIPLPSLATNYIISPSVSIASLITGFTTVKSYNTKFTGKVCSLVSFPSSSSRGLHADQTNSLDDETVID